MVKIILNKDVSAKTLITGFKGFGYVGYLTINHLVDELNAELVGVIDTVYFPPYITVRNGLTYSPYLVYNYKDLIILVFEELSLDEETNYILRKVVEWSKNFGIEKFILIGGLDKSLMREGDSNTKIISNRYWIERYGVVDPLLKDTIRVVGPLAVMLHYASLFQIPAIAILAYADVGIEDARAAANAIDKINEILGLRVSKDKLLARHMMTRKQIEKYIRMQEKRGEGLYA